MEWNDHSRRASDSPVTPSVLSVEDTVRRGILLKHAVSTVAAIEFLKAHNVRTAVIRRVVAGDAMREDDKFALSVQQLARHPSPGL